MLLLVAPCHARTHAHKTKISQTFESKCPSCQAPAGAPRTGVLLLSLSVAPGQTHTFTSQTLQPVTCKQMATQSDWMSLPPDVSAEVLRWVNNERIARRMKQAGCCKHSIKETCRLIRQPGTDDCSPVLIISGATVGAHIHSHGALPGVTLWPRFENPRLLDVTLQGPAGTPYEGGHFLLEMLLPLDYPMESPRVHFVTRVYHPWVNLDGHIDCLCRPSGFDLGMFKGWHWSNMLIDVLLRLKDLLSSAPAAAAVLHCYYGVMDHQHYWQSHEADALQQAKDWTQQYATSDISHHSLSSICWTKQPYDAFWNKLSDLECPDFPHVVADPANDNILVQPVADSGHKSLPEATNAPGVMTEVQSQDECAAVTDDSLLHKTSCKSDSSGKVAHKSAKNSRWLSCWWPPACMPNTCSPLSNRSISTCP